MLFKTVFKLIFFSNFIFIPIFFCVLFRAQKSSLCIYLSFELVVCSLLPTLSLSTNQPGSQSSTAHKQKLFCYTFLHSLVHLVLCFGVLVDGWHDILLVMCIICSRFLIGAGNRNLSCAFSVTHCKGNITLPHSDIFSCHPYTAEQKEQKEQTTLDWGIETVLANERLLPRFILR